MFIAKQWLEIQQFLLASILSSNKIIVFNLSVVPAYKDLFICKDVRENEYLLIFYWILTQKIIYLCIADL